MRRIGFGIVRLAFAASIAAACAPELPIAAAPPAGAALAKGGNISLPYTTTDIGALLGGSSWANDVNDAGEVVGTCCSPGYRAFAVLGGVPRLLAGDPGNGSAISNGSPRYVVGFAGDTSRPARWTIDGGTPSEPTYLALLENELGGAALGVNDAGAAVGRAGSRAAMWSDAGVRTSVAAPAGRGFVRGEGRDINNAGHAVFVFFDGPTESAGARGYLRLASGALVELPPLAGDVTSYANDISEVQNNAAYIAGTTRTGPYVFRSVRWTVNATTGAILSTQVRPENSHALAVSSEGATAGFLETNAERTPKFTAFLWRGSELLSLKPPKGASNGRAWAMSPSGKFVAGDAFFGLTRHALLWTISSP